MGSHKNAQEDHKNGRDQSHFPERWWIMIGRALAIGLLIAAMEVLQGVLRVRLLNRPLGDRRARQVGVWIGSVVILFVAWLSGPWIGASTRGELLAVGAIWLAIMLALDLLFGRWVFKFTWSRIARDFDVRRGGLLGIGMLVVLFAPLIAGKLLGAD
ncbi:hypothetical protein GC207_13410 [bacterium]|nr:hypothetical protein [bacterium]